MVPWDERDVLRKLRAAAGWDLKLLAEKSDLDPQTIHRIESGKTKEPKRSTLRKLAQAFALTEREFEDAVPRDHPGVPLKIERSPGRQAKPASGQRGRTA